MHFLKNIFFMQKNPFHLKRIFCAVSEIPPFSAAGCYFQGCTELVWKCGALSCPHIQIARFKSNKSACCSAAELHHRTRGIMHQPYAFLPICIERLFEKIFGR